MKWRCEPSEADILCIALPELSFIAQFCY
uniref:Uncharacterized protein n=1 Tax=Anguilla anguilla TaxID=7936 RepID=A0A0E9VFC2_ANGAN